MQIPIAASRKMEVETESEISEAKLIRIPSSLRELMCIDLHTYITLRTKTGENISLIVEKAFKEDAEKDSLKAYLTNSTFQLLSEDTEQNVEPCEDITLGCDPELTIINRRNGTIVDAHKIFRKWDAVGSDGLLLELRPLPSTEEDVVVANLFLQMIEARSILTKGKTIFGSKFDGNEYAIIARSYYSPMGIPSGGQHIGFHIHFGLPKVIMVGNYGHLLRSISMLLDYYVGIPAILVEGEHDNVRRSQTKIAYGKPGDWRRGSGNITMEYRVPGGALMKTPETALGIMTIGALVMEDIISRIKAASDGFKNLNNFRTDDQIRELYPQVPTGMDVFTAICSPSIKLARDAMINIYSDFEKMVGFAKRKSTIDQFLNIVSTPLNIPEFVEKNWRVFYEQRQQRSLDVLQQPRSAAAVSG